MAGRGNWSTQNKIIPGAYINFVPVSRGRFGVSERGTVIMPLELDWGAEEELIEVFAEDMTSRRSLAKVGFTAFDEESKNLSLALANCSKAYVYRVNGGGRKATNTGLEGLTIEARRTGVLGNALQVRIRSTPTTGSYIVETFLETGLVHSQRVSSVMDILDNDFVTFVFEDGEEALLADFLTAGETLTGGTNGTTAQASVTNFFDSADTVNWQVMVVPFVRTGLIWTTIDAMIVSYITNARSQNKGVQGIVANMTNPDNVGIINVVQGVVINGITYSISEFGCYVAGISAGANLGFTNTARLVNGATEIIGDLNTTMEIEDAVNAGQFVIARNSANQIAIVTDINSRRPRRDENIAWTKNEIIRTIDTIVTDMRLLWETRFMGQVRNTEDGRDEFKGSMMSYCQDLVNLGALQAPIEAQDFMVAEGDNIFSVEASMNVRFAGSMEMLYLTIFGNA